MQDNDAGVEVEDSEIFDDSEMGQLAEELGGLIDGYEEDGDESFHSSRVGGTILLCALKEYPNPLLVNSSDPRGHCAALGLHAARLANYEAPNLTLTQDGAMAAVGIAREIADNVTHRRVEVIGKNK